ncbi:MAG: hypothetical protein F3745_01100 [Nitrospinae bacterium]|nr:hypothetical protein [Nitrospinota bacterium]
MKFSKVILFIIFFILNSFWFLYQDSAWAIENKSRVISPYWQSDSGSYSFIAVSHSSLTGIASQVGLVFNAIQSDNTAFATALTFTISAGSTERIFIVRTNHPSLSAAAVPSARFLVGTTNFKHGGILVEPVASDPSFFNAPEGRADITMLNFWGAVVIESNTTGFAMEFVGDMHDSSATTTMDDSATVSGVN